MKFIPHSAKADSFSLFRAAKRPRNVAQASGLPYRSASSLLPRAPASRVRLKKISPALAAIIAVFLSVALPAGAREKLAVHEWGTFTSLLDEEGTAIGGINTDDEPVPKFVHRISQELLLRRTEAPPQFFQGAPSCHPDVTMRLETPVLYFHPAENAPAQMI